MTPIQLYTKLYTRVTKVQRCLSPEFRKPEYNGRADEDHSDVGLDSGSVHITGLVKHLVMRLAILVSTHLTNRPLGHPFN